MRVRERAIARLTVAPSAVNVTVTGADSGLDGVSHLARTEQRERSEGLVSKESRQHASQHLLTVTARYPAQEEEANTPNHGQLAALNARIA